MRTSDSSVSKLKDGLDALKSRDSLLMPWYTGHDGPDHLRILSPVASAKKITNQGGKKMNVDTWRRNKAEARQEQDEPTIECPQCYATWIKSEAWECPDCHQHYCPVCKPDSITVCWTCFDHEDAFDEVAEIDEEAKDASS